VGNVSKPGRFSDPVYYIITQTSAQAHRKEQRALLQALRGTSFWKSTYCI